MKTAAQIQARINNLLQEKLVAKDRMWSAKSEAEKELIRTENFARQRDLIMLDWVLE